MSFANKTVFINENCAGNNSVRCDKKFCCGVKYTTVFYFVK